MEPIEIARLEDRRQAVSVGEIAKESEPIAGGFMSFDSPGSWANQACGLGLDGPVSDADLDRLVAWYDQRGVGGEVVVSSTADEGLLKGLADRGYRLAHFENIYAVTAERALESAADIRWPEGVELVRVDPTDADAVREFADVTTGGFEPRLQPDGSVRPMTDAEHDLIRRVVQHPRSVSFAAVAEGKFVAVGGGEVFGEGDQRTACLFGAVTLPAWRRRGLQGAFIRCRSAMFAQSGARVVVVQTKPGIPTERNARRQGFELAYTRASLMRPDPK